MQRETAAPARRWGWVCAMARPGKTVQEKARKALGTPLPRLYSPRTLVPRLPGTRGRNTVWVSRTRRCLRPLGAVPVVLSKTGRHLGPTQTKSLGTHLDEWLPRPVGGAYHRRGPVAQSTRALKTDLGLGEPQGSAEAGRIARAVGLASLAYWLRIRAGPPELLPGTAWRSAQRQPAWR